MCTFCQIFHMGVWFLQEARDSGTETGSVLRYSVHHANKGTNAKVKYA